MPATLLDGRALAARMLDTVAADVRDRVAAGLRPPAIATVVVGDDPASHTYVRMKANRARGLGMNAHVIELAQSTLTAELLDVLHGLSADDGIDGILLQHPVPDHVDERAAFEAIVDHKDVDGVTLRSLARAAFDEPGFRSATPAGILTLLDAYGIDLPGAEVTVVGQGPILGKPLSLMLSARGATVTSCQVQTRDLAAHVGRADIVVAAVGRPHLIRGEWVREGAVVVDAGYSAGSGDVEFEVAAERAAFITPVPGGVGPMTIATLLTQTAQAAAAHSAGVA